jgi:RNA polymerase primary sigma factor
MPHSVGVIEANDDVPKESHLTAAELVQFQRTIEAGMLARDARLSGAGFADATEQELRLLEDQGALARQRFIQANLGLVGMVSRQFAARCQLPDADLFQEGCLGLPACQLPTGSSPCTSLSADSSIMLRSYSSIVSILEAMDACNALTAPSEGVRRSARASGHLRRIAGLRKHNGEVVGDASWPAIIDRHP